MRSCVLVQCLFQRVCCERTGARGEANAARVVGIKCLADFPLVLADPLPFLAQSSAAAADSYAARNWLVAPAAWRARSSKNSRCTEIAAACRFRSSSPSSVKELL
eukprot:151455-Rhodomonas_salina.4